MNTKYRIIMTENIIKYGKGSCKMNDKRGDKQVMQIQFF